MPQKRQREPDDSSSSILRPLESHRLRLQKLKAKLDHFRSSDHKVFPVPVAVWVGLEEANALEAAVSSYTSRKNLSERHFLERILCPCVDAALSFDTLFVPDEGKWINRQYSKLSRQQLFCLVSNSFLCTFAERAFEDDDSMPSINYTEMHCGSEGSLVEVVKLELLFDYLAHMGGCQEKSRKAVVAIARTACPPLAFADEVMLPLTVRALGESIDDQAHFVRLDFANRWIGGGALADGCVQEEITFAQCPELNALRWNHGPLQDEEAVVVRGYQQYSSIAKGTYGGGIRYGHALTPPVLCDGALLILDALDFRYEDESMLQYTAWAVERELRKLVSGLSSPVVKEYEHVAGGNWGCGVFEGDYELKLLLQWLACAVTGKRLHYFPFDIEEVAAFQSLADALCQTGFTARELHTFLTQLEEEPEEGVWNALVEWFHETRRAGSEESDVSDESETES